MREAGERNEELTAALAAAAAASSSALAASAAFFSASFSAATVGREAEDERGGKGEERNEVSDLGNEETTSDVEPEG